MSLRQGRGPTALYSHSETRILTPITLSHCIFTLSLNGESCRWKPDGSMCQPRIWYRSICHLRRGPTSHPAGFYVTHHASTVELPHLPHQWLATYLFLNANGPGSLQPVYQLRSSPVLLKTFVAWRRRRDGPGTLVRLYAANGTIVACDSTHASTFKGSFVRFFLSPVLISLTLCRMVASPSTYPRIRSLRPNLDVPF